LPEQNDELKVTINKIILHYSVVAFLKDHPLIPGNCGLKRETVFRQNFKNKFAVYQDMVLKIRWSLVSLVSQTLYLPLHRKRVWSSPCKGFGLTGVLIQVKSHWSHTGHSLCLPFVQTKKSTLQQDER